MAKKGLVDDLMNTLLYQAPLGIVGSLAYFVFAWMYVMTMGFVMDVAGGLIGSIVGLSIALILYSMALKFHKGKETFLSILPSLTVIATMSVVGATYLGLEFLALEMSFAGAPAIMNTIAMALIATQIGRYVVDATPLAGYK